MKRTKLILWIKGANEVYMILFSSIFITFGKSLMFKFFFFLENFTIFEPNDDENKTF